MEVSLLISEMERRIADFKSKKEYDCADALRDLKVEIEHGDFYGTIYHKFTEWTGDDVAFTDDEKKKLLYLLIKKRPGRQALNDHSFCVHRDIEGKTCVLQATVDENPHTKQDEVQVVISGGHGYNEFNSEKFKELLIHF